MPPGLVGRGTDRPAATQRKSVADAIEQTSLAGSPSKLLRPWTHLASERQLLSVAL